MNYNYNKNVNDHSEELYQLSRLVSPNFSQIKSELSHKETVGKGCKHIINAITCPFRRAWYGISHLTWITDKKIEKKISNHVTLLNNDLDKMYESEFKEVKGFVDVSVKKAKKALIRLQQPKDVTESRINLALSKIDQIEKLCSIEELNTEKEALIRLQQPKDVPESQINLALSEINQIENSWSIEELNSEKEAILTREQNPLEESKDPLTPRILGHVLGGFMIAGIDELEGSASSKTINYVLEFIDNYLPQSDKQSHPISSEKLLPLKKQLEKAQEISLQVDVLQKLTHEIATEEKMNQSNMGLVSEEDIIEKKKTWESQKQAFVSEVLKELNSLEKGQNLLFPGGWTGVPGTPGHAMLYRFEKNNDGKINLSIINTGAGISTHEQTFEVMEGTKKKYNPVRQFDNLSFVDGEIDEKLILSFLEKRLLPLTYEAPAFDSNDIYGVEVERLKFKEVTPSFILEETITGQRSGVCAYKSVLIAARLILGVEDYKIFKHHLELEALENGVKKLTNGEYAGSQENNVIHILERSSKRMMAATLKLRRAKLISKKEAREAYNIATTTLKSIDTYKKQPVKFIPIQNEPTYSETSLSKSINLLQNSIVRATNQQFNDIGITSAPPPQSQNPKEFLKELNHFIQYLPQGSEDQIAIFNVLNKIDYANHSDIWDAITQDPILREEAIVVMADLSKKINQITEKNRVGISSLPIETTALINAYAINSLLAKHQWASEPKLAEYAANSNIFKNLAMEWGCKDFFRPSFETNLHTLEELNKNKTLLFELIYEKEFDLDIIKFNNPNVFKNIPDLMFLENFLLSYPDVANKIPLSDKDMEVIYKAANLGNGINERTLRYKALQLYTSTNNEIYSNYTIIDIDNPSLKIFSALQNLNKSLNQSIISENQSTFFRFITQMSG